MLNCCAQIAKTLTTLLTSPYRKTVRKKSRS